ESPETPVSQGFPGNFLNSDNVTKSDLGLFHRAQDAGVDGEQRDVDCDEYRLIEAERQPGQRQRHQHVHRRVQRYFHLMSWAAINAMVGNARTSSRRAVASRRTVRVSLSVRISRSSFSTPRTMSTSTCVCSAFIIFSFLRKLLGGGAQVLDQGRIAICRMVLANPFNMVGVDEQSCRQIIRHHRSPLAPLPT